MRISAGLTALCLISVACGARTLAPTPPLHASEPSPALSPTASAPPIVSPSPPQRIVFLPPPNAPLPRQPGPVAHGLAKVTRAVRESIRHWLQQGGPLAKPPRRVVLQALFQQRIYRLLMRDPRLARRVVRLLPSSLRGSAIANVEAGSKLLSLVTPIKTPAAFETGPPEPAGLLLRWLKQAGRRFGVAWEVLAAVMYVESKFGRVKAVSTAGAQGPMQFLPSTWARYGLGGDVRDPHDAILGAANYLRASGAPGDYRGALYAYNHAAAYVDGVLLYANEMRKEERSFFAYYNWQVFVVTTKGDKRLTGP